MSEVEGLFGGEPDIKSDAAPTEAIPAPEPVEPEAAPVVEPVAVAPPAEPVIPEGYVPVAVVKELRDEIRGLRDVPAPAPPQPVDMFDDPSGYDASVSSRILNVKLDLSETMNAERHGVETVEAAKAWALAQFQSAPGFQQQVFGKSDPYGFVIAEMRKSEAIAALGDANPEEISQFKAWKAQQALLAQQAAAQPAATSQPAAAPPPSLASVPNAGDSSAAPKPNPDEEKANAMFG